MVDEVIYKLNVGDDNKKYYNNSLHNRIDSVFKSYLNAI